MLLELCPPPDDASCSSFRLHLAFTEPTHSLPNPSAWVAQLNAISTFSSELDARFNMHLLDRAVGLGTLLERVRVDLFRDDAASSGGSLGVRVHCILVDSRVVEWCVSPSCTDDADQESSRLLRALEHILRNVEWLEDTKRKLAVELEEKQRQTELDRQKRYRHQQTLSLEPVSLGRKGGHKRQKSFLQSIVSAVGSIMTSQRSSSTAHSRTRSGGPILPTSFSRHNYPADYPFPMSPSPSPPLSPSHSPSPTSSGPSRSGSPSPEVASTSSCTTQNGHTHAPHTYTYGAQHHPPLPPNPWSPPPASPPVSTLPYPAPDSHHQAQIEALRASISTSLIDVYRRFVLGALVFGFAKEIGLGSDDTPQHTFNPGSSGSETLVGSPMQSISTSASPVIPAPVPTPNIHPLVDIRSFNPNAHPSRASYNSANTYNYQLWLLRSMLCNAEEEVREIVEACEVSVREDFLKAAQADCEVDVVDVDMTVDVNRSWGRQRGGMMPASPTSPTGTTASRNRKVSFDSFKSGGSGGGSGSPKKSTGAASTVTGNEKGATLTKKKSRGKLMKKRSVVGMGASASEGDKDKDTQQRSKTLGLIGSWGKSKVLVPSSKSSPPLTQPIMEAVPVSDDAVALPLEAIQVLPNQYAVAEIPPQDLAEEGAAVLEPLTEVEEQVPVVRASSSDPSPMDITNGSEQVIDEEDNASSMSHATGGGSSSGCGSSLESTSTTASTTTVSTGLTTPAGSEALSRCGSVTESGEPEDEEEDIGVVAANPDPDSQSPRGSFEEEDELQETQQQESRGVYGNSLLSQSTGNLLDEPNPASMSSTSLLVDTTVDDFSAPPQYIDFIPASPTSSPCAARPTVDINAPDFQLHLRIRLNLHPAYTRLTQRAAKLRELLVEAEEERRERREEELRCLDMLEVRSRRRAWSAGVLKRGSAADGMSSMLLPELSAPFKSSALALGGWTNEEMEAEGWEYVCPPNPHPLFHGQGRRGDMTFPSVRDIEDCKGLDADGGKMKKADMKMSMRMERGWRKPDDAMGNDNAFCVDRLVDDREGCGHEGVVQFCLDANWNSHAILDSDDSEEEDVGVYLDGRVFGHQRRQHKQSEWKRERERGRSAFEDDDDVGDLHDISNIPPRPRVKPTKHHPPPARLFVVAEEEEILDESDDLETRPASAGTATETETEGEMTEGEGDEFEFDNVGVARLPAQMGVVTLTGTGSEDEGSEDEDEDFFADINDITDIVGDIEDGLGRHGHYPTHCRPSQHAPTSPESATTPDGHPVRSSRRSGLDLRPEEIEQLDGSRGRGYPYDSFDVDVEMGLRAGEGLRASSLEWEYGSSAGMRSEVRERDGERHVRARPRTPYPKDEEEDEEEKGPDQQKVDSGSRKRARNHKRQWQAMLGSGNRSVRSPSDDEFEGIEIAMEVEKPKPRFMPTVKKVIMGGRGSKSHRDAASTTESSDTTPIKTTYHEGKPRARTRSMYHRQPSPHSRAAFSTSSENDDLLDLDNETAEDRPAVPAGLPLGIGFGYGSYSNNPSPPIPKSDTALSKNALLYQPVRFALPPDSSATFKSPAVPQFPTKSLGTSFSAPATATARPRKHVRSVHLNLDLEAGPVDDYAVSGYGQWGELDSSGRRTPNSASSSWSSHSDSTCSSASLPMSPLSPPSPVVGVASTSSLNCSGSVSSPIIRGHTEELADELVEPRLALTVGGTWENASVANEGEEFTLAMDVPRRTMQPSPKKHFHLPSSLLLPKGSTPDPVRRVGPVDDHGAGTRRGSRKSVLADPCFFEPPAAASSATLSEIASEEQVVECR